MTNVCYPERSEGSAFHNIGAAIQIHRAQKQKRERAQARPLCFRSKPNGKEHASLGTLTENNAAHFPSARN
jgi:hypothetical protein